MEGGKRPARLLEQHGLHELHDLKLVISFYELLLGMHNAVSSD